MLSQVLQKAREFLTHQTTMIKLILCLVSGKTSIKIKQKFRNDHVITKIMKILCNEILELYGMASPQFTTAFMIYSMDVYMHTISQKFRRN